MSQSLVLKRQRVLTAYTGFQSQPAINGSNVSTGKSGSCSEAGSSESQVSNKPTSCAEFIQRECRRKKWKDGWLAQWDWIEWEPECALVFCKLCRANKGENKFATTGSTNVKTSAFIDHSRSKDHKAFLHATLFGRRAMEKAQQSMRAAASSAAMTLFRCAYFIGKQELSFKKFPFLCGFLREHTDYIPVRLYDDDKACAEMIYHISSVIHRSILREVRDSPFFGLMVDEATDISATGHVVVFLSYIFDFKVKYAFLGLLATGDKTANGISTSLIQKLEEWQLDCSRLVAFGSDGASTMTGSVNGVGACLKKRFNPRLISIHCITHRTNLAAVDAQKDMKVKAMSVDIDGILTNLANYFRDSPKRKAELAKLQSELDDACLTMKRFVKTRWLSRWQCVRTLCDSLESVLVYLTDAAAGNKGRRDQPMAMLLLPKLTSFEIIYILYFLADILDTLAHMSLTFQHEAVDPTGIGSLVASTLAEIKLLYIDGRCNLNVGTTNEATGYPILPDFGPDGGYMCRLSSELRGKFYHGVEIQRCTQGIDLESALAFQKDFANAVYNSLEKRFLDNHLFQSFRILSPQNMPTAVKSLKDWGMRDLETLCAHYGQEVNVSRHVSIPPLITPAAVKSEFLHFKIQASSEWQDREFFEIWSMISRNPTYKGKYPNLLIWANLARVQCVSTAICERAFSTQNNVKTKCRNSLGTEHLEACMRVTIEGPDTQTDDLLAEAIENWKSSAQYRYLFSNPEIHLPTSVSQSVLTA